jgi:hypothetical protein
MLVSLAVILGTLSFTTILSLMRSAQVAPETNEVELDEMAEAQMDER